MTSVWQYMGKLGDKDRYKVTGITSFQCTDWVQKKKTSDISSLINDIMKWKRGIFHLMFSLLFFFFADFDQLPEVIILNSFSAYMCHDLMAKHLHGDGQRLAKNLTGNIVALLTCRPLRHILKFVLFKYPKEGFLTRKRKQNFRSLN